MEVLELVFLSAEMAQRSVIMVLGFPRKCPIISLTSILICGIISFWNLLGDCGDYFSNLQPLVSQFKSQKEGW